MVLRGFGAKVLREAWLTTYEQADGTRSMLFSDTMCISSNQCTEANCRVKDITEKDIEALSKKASKFISSKKVDFMCKIANFPLICFQAEDADKQTWQQYVSIDEDLIPEDEFESLFTPIEEILKDVEKTIEFMGRIEDIQDK